MKLNCKHCGRYLGEFHTVIGEILCSNSSCKATNQFKIIKMNEFDTMNFKFSEPERQPKGKETTS